MPSSGVPPMILQCPACATRYVVPDSAVGAAGRTVRCAACRHSWFQEPDAPLDAPAPRTPAPPAPEPAFEERMAEPPPVETIAPRRRRPRRDPARRWTIAAVAAALAMIAAIVALTLLGSPGTLARLGLPVADAGDALVIDLPREPERRELASGNELFALAGRVTNPTEGELRVPDIVAELRDAQGRTIYEWTIPPPVRTLAPGATTEFLSSKVDVPAGAQELNLSFAGSAN